MIVISLKLPFISTSNVMINKLYLFIGVFLLQVVVLTTNNLNQKCKPMQMDTLREAAKIALLAVVGYSLYIDIVISPQFKSRFTSYVEEPRKNMFFISFIIAGFITSYKIIDNTLLPVDLNCE
jgi:hypothetical protein